MSTETASLLSIRLKKPSRFFYDKSEQGWELIADVDLTGTPNLALCPFLRGEESRVYGALMVARGQEMARKINGNLAGQLHAEQLWCQQNRIDPEWSQFVLVFPGTIWRDLAGCFQVPYFYHNRGDKEQIWVIDWLPLDGFYGGAFTTTDMVVLIDD